MTNAEHVYTAPCGNDHHGRLYASEAQRLLQLQAPRRVLALYYALTTFSTADRQTAKIFAADATIMERACIGRTTFYLAMDWLKQECVIHSITRKGKRVILWGPQPLKVVEPVQPIEQTRPIESKPSPKPVELKKIEPELPKMEQPLDVSKIPAFKGQPEDIPKGIDRVEYAQRKQELHNFGWFTPKQIVDLCHYSPGVSAAWVRAYGGTRTFRAEIVDHRSLLNWHFGEIKHRKQGVIVDPQYISKALSSIHISRPYVSAELDGLKLVPTTCAKQMANAESEAVANKSGKSQELKDAIAATKKKLKESKAIPLLD